MGIVTATYESPSGPLLVGATETAVCLCAWTSTDKGSRCIGSVSSLSGLSISSGSNPVLMECLRQLDCYFNGELTDFDIPTVLFGTPFRKTVWQALLSIPYGATVSYSQVAAAVGRPRAVRAVANAIGANPVSIIVPCHRVVGSDGSLTGYAGGTDTKASLLNLEKGKGLFNK